jgi:hypothetical protein
MSEELPKELPKGKKPDLVLAIAQGVAVAKWAKANEVAPRTAYRWAKEPKVRAAVESVRRRALDRAVGRMATRATWSADKISELAAHATSESVRLSALRAILFDMMNVTKYTTLESRMAAVEGHLRDRPESPDEAHGAG